MNVRQWISYASAAVSAAVLWGLCAMTSVSRAATAPADALTPAKACSGLVHFGIPGSTLVITRAAEVPAARAGSVAYGNQPGKVPVAIPAHCRVEGVIHAHTGPDGKSYGLTFALALPDLWDGRFLYQGGGGLNGALLPPLGAQAAGSRPALARGFAVVSTDGGHRGAVFDTTFLADQQASLDFAFDAVPTVARVAKRVIFAYYGKAPARSYFDGCSTGGRESMEAVERYPLLFDGVLTGSPAMRTGYSNIALEWAAVAFNRIAPRNPATGEPIPGGAFTAQDRRLIVDGVLKACDALDGVKDGMIFNVAACHFDPAALECKGTKTPRCLSAAQVSALKTAFGGPVTADGERVYVPFPYDTGIAATPATMFPPGLLLDSGGGPVGGGKPPLTIDLAAQLAAVRANALEQLVDTNRWTNLGTFAAHGGKQIIYHGMSDPWFSAFDTLGYYERVVRDNGGLAKTRRFARLFLVPGMGHCMGGPATLDRFDLLTPLVNWVEHGKAPRSVVATGRDFPGRSRPLCAWPSHAQYKGHGNPNDASSFYCRT
jgi:Tannase and feruloyl esterase